MIPESELAGLPFFTGFPQRVLQRLAAVSQTRDLTRGEVMAHQHDRASAVYFLRSGTLQFLTRVEGLGDLLVGVLREPGALVGWSALRAPYRYTVTVRCEEESRLIRIPRDELAAILREDPAMGVELMHRVAEVVAARLEDARDRLVAVSRTPGEPAQDGGQHSPVLTPPAWAARVNPDTASIAIFLAHVPLGEGLPEACRLGIAGIATLRTLEEGEALFEEHQDADALYLLVRGRLALSFEAGDALVGRVSLREVADIGQEVGWSALVTPHRYRATATAAARSTVLALPRAALDSLCHDDPDLGIAVMERVLWIVGNRLRATRVRFIARRYRHETLAVRAMLDQNAEALPVTSPLHKLPYLLDNRLTLSDAFQTLELVKAHGSELERELAALSLDLLADVRRELRFYEGLQRVYEEVANAPADTPPAVVRRRCNDEFARLFADTRYVIRGEENLPERPGHIVIMNHLENHPDNLLPNDFRLTLDTHFVSSMILQPRYGEAPVRVVRKPAPDWYGFQQYFDRLGYIYVYSGAVDEEDRDQQLTSEDRRLMFLEAGREHLAAGRNVVICPEGACAYTEESPRPFKGGAFRLAAYVKPEPLIVPVAVANFDGKITRSTTAAVVHPPFRLSEEVADAGDREALAEFLQRYTARYRNYVLEAVHAAQRAAAGERP